MRFATLALCLLAAAVWCSTVQAGEKKSSTVYEGWINNLPDNTIAMNQDVDGHTVRRIIYVNNETTITVNGKPGNHGTLAKGMIIRVTMKNTKIAASVEAVSPKKKN